MFELINKYLNKNDSTKPSINYTNKVYTAIYKDGTQKQLVIHVDENYYLDQYKDYELNNYVLHAYDKNIDMNHDKNIGIMMHLFLELAVKYAKILFETFKDDLDNILFIVIGTVSSDLAYFIAPLLASGMYIYKIEDNIMYFNHNSEHVKSFIPLYQGYYTLSGLHVVNGGAYNNINVFIDMFIIEFINHESLKIYDEIKQGFIKHYPLLFAGFSEQWAIHEHTYIFDAWLTINNILYFITYSPITYSFLCTKSDISIFKLYSSDMYNINVNDIDMIVLLSKHPGTSTNYCLSRGYLADIDNCMLPTAVKIEKQAKMNMLKYFDNILVPCISRTIKDIDRDYGLDHNFKTICYLCSSYPLIRVTNNYKVNNKKLTMDDIKMTPSSEISDNNPFYDSSYNMKLYKYNIDNYDFYCTCCSAYNSSMCSKRNFRYKISINSLAIFKSFNQMTINKMIPINKNSVVLGIKKNEKNIKKDIELYRSYIKLWINYIKNLTKDDLEYLRKLIIPKYIVSQFPAFSVQYFNDDEYKEGAEFTKNSITKLSSIFDKFLFANNDEINRSTDNNFPKRLYKISISNTEKLFTEKIPRSLYLNCSYICCAHNVHNTYMAGTYGTGRMFFDLHKLLDKDIYCSISSCDKGYLTVWDKCNNAIDFINDEAIMIIVNYRRKVYEEFNKRVDDLYINHDDKNIEEFIQFSKDNNQIGLVLKLDKDLLTCDTEKIRKFIFKLYLYGYGFFQINDSELMQESIIEIFNSNEIDNVNKLHMSRINIFNCIEYSEYDIYYTTLVEKYIKNLNKNIDNNKIYSTIIKRENINKIINEIIEELDYNFDKELMYKFISKNLPDKDVKYYQFVLHMYNKWLSSNSNIVNKSKYEIDRGFDGLKIKEIILKIFSKVYDLVKYNTYLLSDKQLEKIKQEFDKGVKEVISTIHDIKCYDKYFFSINDLRTRTLDSIENGQDVIDNKFIYYKVDDKMIDKDPIYWSVYYLKWLYKDVTEEMKEKLNGGMSGGKLEITKNKKILCLIISLILIVIAVVIVIVIRYVNIHDNSTENFVNMI